MLTVLLAVLTTGGVTWWLRRPRVTAGPLAVAAAFVPAAPVAPHSGYEARLIIVSGIDVDQDRSFQVGSGPVTVGSGATCDLRLADVTGVASQHARLWWRDGRLMLHHIAPGHTTLVGGRDVTWAAIEDGDEIAIGPYVLRCTLTPGTPGKEADLSEATEKVK